MPSLTDELSKNFSEKAQKTVKTAAQTAEGVGKKILEKGPSTLVKGVCLILTGCEFTTENVMKMAKTTAYKATKDIKFSPRNINIGQLQKSGCVKKIDEAVTADVMKYFNNACRKYNVHYSAMKDTSNPDNPSYIVFYEGKNTDIILQAVKEACSDYMKDQQKAKDRTADEKSTESVLAKTAFFRDRAAAGEQERQPVEKNKSHTEPQR